MFMTDAMKISEKEISIPRLITQNFKCFTPTKHGFYAYSSRNPVDGAGISDTGAMVKFSGGFYETVTCLIGNKITIALFAFTGTYDRNEDDLFTELTLTDWNFFDDEIGSGRDSMHPEDKLLLLKLLSEEEDYCSVFSLLDPSDIWLNQLKMDLEKKSKCMLVG